MFDSIVLNEIRRCPDNNFGTLCFQLVYVLSLLLLSFSIIFSRDPFYNTLDLFQTTLSQTIFFVDFFLAKKNGRFRVVTPRFV